MTDELRSLYPCLYGNDVDERMMDRRFRALSENYRSIFRSSSTAIFSASGRTEIGGNHTDHNRGKVIGGAINLDTVAAAGENDSSLVVFHSEGFPSFSVDISDTNVHEDERNTTASLVRGIAAHFKENGVECGGWNAYCTSRVLPGSGLSSSASVEVLIASVMNSLFAEDRFSPMELATAGGWAENRYFGKPCGLLDQISSACGGIVLADFESPSSPLVTNIDYDFSARGYSMVITNCGGNHMDLTSEYAAIPREMKAVAAWYGKESLREVNEKDFICDIRKIRKDIGNDRAILRAYHYFNENRRVDKMVEALEKDDMESFLDQVRESGGSSFRFLQNVYPSQMPGSQDIALALAAAENYLGRDGAARVHGGGFAGTIQAYVPTEMEAGYITYMDGILGEGSSERISIRKRGAGRLV